jgi:hypothetical protein
MALLNKLQVWLLTGIVLAGASHALEVVGPTATLTISNVQLSPDGTTRE